MAVIAIAIIAAIAPLPPKLVERAYSNGFYPFVQTHLTPITNLIPIALVDIGALVVVFVVVRYTLGLRRTPPRSIVRDALRRLVVFAAVVYLAFLVVWGLN